MSRRRFATYAPAAMIGLSGCANDRFIDPSYSSQAQDSRVLYLILHYTALNLADSLSRLTQSSESAHYLVTNESPARVYRLVDETKRAWHSGKSYWQGDTMLNAASIGIEIVNPGLMSKPDGSHQFAAYPTEQIDRLILLIQSIVRRHNIRSDRILGHSDIAPLRKVDPGAEFPWKRLADQGLITWPQPHVVAKLLQKHQRNVPDAQWFQRNLAEFGYFVEQTGKWDESNQKTLAAFQMKYRPSSYTGQRDAESAALLEALCGPED